MVLPTMYALAQPDNDGRKQDRKERIKALKIAYMTSELNLTPDESMKFWPVYNEFQDKLHELRENTKPKKEASDMTDAEAEELIEMVLSAEQQKVDLLRETIYKLKPIIGAQRVVVVQRVEDKFREKLLRKAGEKAGNRKDKRRRN